MTVLAVLADPPRPGLVLPELPAATPLSAAEAADLYAAALADVCRAVARSGGELLVNYRPDDLLPEEYVREESAEAAVRAALDDAGDGEVVLDGARFEVQVGSTRAARIGNTVTHLLREEAATSAAVVRPTAPLLERSVVDGAAMKLRRSPVVLGPATGGRAYYAGFTDVVDFADADAVPELGTLADRARAAGHDADFLRSLPVLDSAPGLVSTVATVRARRQVGRPVPPATAEAAADLGLRVADRGDGRPELVRE